MRVLSLDIENYCNFSKSSFTFSPSFNFIYGPNGSGKSNLIEALIFSFSGRIPRKKKDEFLIKKGESFFKLKVEAELLEEKLEIICDYKKKKNFFLNQKKVYRLSELLPYFRLIYFFPEDIRIIDGFIKERRKFFDLEFSKYDNNYFSLLQEYKKVLFKRNRLLWRKKSGEKIDYHLFKVIDEEFINLNVKISLLKFSFLFNINNYLQDNKIHYKFSNVISVNTPENIKKGVFKLHEKFLNQERKKGYSLWGVHRDEFIFGRDFNDKILMYEASRGEKLKFIFFLKMAFLKFWQKKNLDKMVILIDDFFNFFDYNNFYQLIENLRENQIFFTSQKKISLPDVNGVEYINLGED